MVTGGRRQRGRMRRRMTTKEKETKGGRSC
jgi:hypothetical protein